MWSWLFPPVCAGCGLLLRPDAPPTLPLCLACALEHAPLPAQALVRGGIAAVHAYGGPLLRALTRLKFHGQPAWAGPLGAALSASPCWDDGWDAVIPIPLHPRRLRARGFNQAASIARFALRHRPAPAPPLRPRWLQRVRDTPPQHRRGAAARHHNLRGAFVVPTAAHGSIRGRRVLLVDDVTTTGATLHAAQRAVQRAGAATVGALALLRTLA